MSFETATPFTIVGSGAGAVEIADNSPGSPQYTPPTPPTLNDMFSIDATLSPIKRLKWDGDETIAAAVVYYGTFQLTAGGTVLSELSLARDGVQDATSKILIELAGNRPNFILDTTLINLEPGEALSPMIENVGSATEIEVYSAHMLILGVEPV
jgi:hypothetical protein